MEKPCEPLCDGRGGNQFKPFPTPCIPCKTCNLKKWNHLHPGAQHSLFDKTTQPTT